MMNDIIFKISIVIIAICEVIRMIQNGIQVHAFKTDTSKRDDAYSEFIKSLRYTDKEFVKKMLEKFDELDSNKGE